jgi:hypothetical protein
MSLLRPWYPAGDYRLSPLLWASLGGAQAWPCSIRIPHAFLGPCWLSARTRCRRLRGAGSSRALLAARLLIVEAYLGFGWRALSSGRPNSLLPRRQCHDPFAESFRLISLIASFPVILRERGDGVPARAAFRLLVWRPVRVRVDG